MKSINCYIDKCPILSEHLFSLRSKFRNIISGKVSVERLGYGSVQPELGSAQLGHCTGVENNKSGVVDVRFTPEISLRLSSLMTSQMKDTYRNTLQQFS